MFRSSSGHDPFILDMEDGAPRNNQIIGGGQKNTLVVLSFPEKKHTVGLHTQAKIQI